MRGSLPAHRRTSFVLLLALLLLPAASAEDVRSHRWAAGSIVRVATSPALRPLPAELARSMPLPTLAHGYAGLVARHARLQFVDHPYPTTGAAIAAVCAREADLVLVVGNPGHPPPPCPGMVASPRFHGGKTVLAGRPGEWLPRDINDFNGRVLAVVEGGPYAGWLRAHHPQIQLLHRPDLHAALAAVIAGHADAAVGVETTLRPMVRRYFPGELDLHPVDSAFSTDLRLLARRDDIELLERIQQGLQRITLEEHASLLQRWAGQMLPEPFGRALHWIRTPQPWWHLAVLALVATPFLLLPSMQYAITRACRGQARAIGMLSHEIRNAAQALLASVRLLRQSPGPARQDQLLAAADAAGHSLRSLLDRSLDFSRLQSGTFQPDPRPCDLTQLCSQAIAAIRPQAELKGLQVHLEVPRHPSLWLHLDPDALRHIVDNLLANALKFTDAGSIHLRVRLVPGARPQQLVLDVIDSGIGIGSARMASIFEPFQQGAEGGERGGSGLGLAIARELAVAMGGALTVHSVRGRGSRFTLRVPVRAATPGPRHPDTARRPGMPLAGLELLLVEDHALNRHLIAGQLQRLGADVLALADAASAIAEQARRPRAAVLLDIGLRGMDGYALARRLRRDAQGPLRLIALSAHTGRRHAIRCRQAGFDAVLTKPLRTGVLLQVLGLSPEEAEILDAPTTPDPAYAVDIAVELGEIDRALAEADAERVRHHAHRLQGTLQFCGAVEQAGIAADLWALARLDSPDWAGARHLLASLQRWHGDLAQAPMPAP